MKNIVIHNTLIHKELWKYCPVILLQSLSNRIDSSCCVNNTCHFRESGNPDYSHWTSAFAGMTSTVSSLYNTL